MKTKHAMPLILLAALCACAAEIIPAETLGGSNTVTRGTAVCVRGTVAGFARDGLSSSAILMDLDGGLRCRISRAPFRDNRVTGARCSVKTETGGRTLIELNGREILAQGCTVLLRGTVKDEMRRVVLDKASLLGCSDKTAREFLRLSCRAACAPEPCPVCNPSPKERP